MQQPADSAKKVPNQFFWHISKIVRNAPIHITTWMYDNKKTYPGFIFRAGFVAVGIIMATVSMHMVSTAFAVITEDVLMQAATAIGLIGFFILLLLMARGTYLAGMHTWKDWSENPPIEVQKLITAPTWTPPDISPDILVCGTDEKAFAVMAEAAFKQTSHAIWAVIIPPFEKEASIITADKATDFFFDRGNEPFSDRIQPEAALPAGLDHIGENEIMYRKYVTWFCAHYRQWRGAAKLEANKERAKQTMIEVIEAKAKAVTVALSFLLFCLPVFGQSKARQVDEVLGTRIREIPEAGEKVTFIFREGSKDKYYERTGDGKSEYTDLLQKTSGLVKYNDQGGELVAIMKNGEAVAKAAHVERVNEVPKQQSPAGPNGAVYLPPNNTGDPIRPRGTLQAPDVANTPVADEPLNIHIPTPDEVQTTLDNASREIDYRKTEAWAAIKPIWKWIMGMFFSIVPLFICLGGLFRYYAGTAANESFYGLSGIGILIRRVHETASGVTLLICWGIATVLLIDEFMLFVYLGIPLWLMLATWFPSLFLAKVLTNWAVPNPPELGHGRGGYDQPYAGQRRIG
jgi:hypothetical protein